MDKKKKSRQVASPNLFRIPSNLTVSIGLQWEFIGDEPIDLDASCVIFDSQGCVVDCVFYNRLRADGSYVEHTGDNTTGEDDGEDDESIIIQFDRIPADVHYLMFCVTSYSGADFSVVSQALCRVVNVTTREVVGKFCLGIIGAHTATLLCAVSRLPVVPNDPDQSQWWEMRELNVPCKGKTFMDVLPKMQEILGLTPEKIAERRQHCPAFKLEKSADNNDAPLSLIKLGLGWDGENDLDAVAMFLNDKGQYHDHVYAKNGKLTSRDRAAKHSGDKQHGYDVNGDDEEIEIDLSMVDRRVEVIIFAVLLYGGMVYALKNVPHCFVRLLNKGSRAEKGFKVIDTFPLSKSTVDGTGFIYSALVRNETGWDYTTLREKVGGKDWLDIFPHVRTIAPFVRDLSEWPAFRQRALLPMEVGVTILCVRNLGPLEPHRFRCHCQGWIFDRKDSQKQKSRYADDRNQCDFGDTFTFRVNMMDIIRVMVYEFSCVGSFNLVVRDVDWNQDDRIEQWFPLEGHDITGEIFLRISRKMLPATKIDVLDSQGSSWCSVM